MIGHVLQEFVFPCVGSVKTSGTLKEACGNSYPQQRMFVVNINTIQGEFFLVHLFYSSSFGSINSIKGIGNSSIVRLTFLCEVDVNSTC